MLGLTASEARGMHQRCPTTRGECLQPQGQAGETRLAGHLSSSCPAARPAAHGQRTCSSTRGWLCVCRQAHHTRKRVLGGLPAGEEEKHVGACVSRRAGDDACAGRTASHPPPGSSTPPRLTGQVEQGMHPSVPNYLARALHGLAVVGSFALLEPAAGPTSVVERPPCSGWCSLRASLGQQSGRLDA